MCMCVCVCMYAIHSQSYRSHVSEIWYIGNPISEDVHLETY